MKVVITMAGEGTRFKKKGIETEKHRIKIKEKTMFEWAMSSLTEFFEEEFVFISKKENNDAQFIERKCRDLGIRHRKILEISETTDGQATTVLEAQQEISEDDEIAIYNIDTYIKSGCISRQRVEGDGHIPVFRPQGSKWSFVKTDRDEKVVDVAEKKRISDLATVGFYYFKNFRDYKRAYNQIGAGVQEKYGEKYVAPLYQWFIDADKDITVQEIENENIHVLGTPEDVTRFWPQFSSRVD